MGLKGRQKVTPIRPVFYDPARDGVTYSLLSTFLDCREKARLFLEGWSGTGTSFALIFGSVVHRVLQNAYQHPLPVVPDKRWVEGQLGEIQNRWEADNPTAPLRTQEDFHEAMMKAQAILPHYFSYWKTDFDPLHRQWIEIEDTFRLDWTVRTRAGVELNTFLRGRVDGVFNRGTGRLAKRPRILETKTRSHVDEMELMDTMPHERQVNIYASAIRRKFNQTPASVQLNVIRKPALRQTKGEDWKQFAVRISQDVRQRPDWYFLRMEMTIDDQDINREEADLNELVADFLLWRAGEHGHYKNTNACNRFGQLCPYIKVCSQRDYIGLIKRDVVFRELEDE